MRTLAGVLFLFAAAPVLSEEMVQNFRSKDDKTRQYHYEGFGAEQFIASEEQGFRIAFPAGNAPGNGVGVGWNLQMKGDFVATAFYEILQGDESSVLLYLGLDSPTKDGISLAHRIDSTKGSRIAFSHRIATDAGRRVTKSSSEFPVVPGPRGRLRLAREGPTLIVSTAAGDDGPFQELHRGDIGTMVVSKVTLTGVPKGPNAILDLRLLEVRLQAEGLILQAERKSGGNLWRLIALAILLGMLLLLGGWFALRHSVRRNHPAPTSAKA